MDTKEFREVVKKTAAGLPVGEARHHYLIYGLSSERGEIADLLKRSIRDRAYTLDRQDLLNELGDQRWYLTALCIDIGVPPSLELENLMARGMDDLPLPLLLELAGDHRGLQTAIIAHGAICRKFGFTVYDAVKVNAAKVLARLEAGTIQKDAEGNR